jgi:AcrR family transcriptional regulator
MSTAGQASARASRLHQEDWLRHALEALRLKGVSGLRVEPLARSLGVTTGSFYWHFSDRRDLLDRVLAHWTETMMRGLAERMICEDEAEVQLRRLLEDVVSDDRSRYEIPIRSWASFDAAANRAVRKVDECRLAYVTGLFLRLGFSEEQAQLRANLLIFYEIGEAGFSIRDRLERRLELARLRLDLLTTPDPTSLPEPTPRPS